MRWVSFFDDFMLKHLSRKADNIVVQIVELGFACAGPRLLVTNFRDK